MIFSIALAKDMLITAYVERAVREPTGLALKITKLRTELIKGRASIAGLEIFNPPNFKDRTMLELGRIYMDYDFAALLNRNIHLSELDIDLKEFVIVKNKDGELNLNSLKIVKHNKEPGEKKDMPKYGVFHLKIDLLRLKIGRVLYKDYTHGKEPRIKVYNINMDEKFTDIEDIHTLTSTVMLKALSKTNIGMIAGFNLKLLKINVLDKSLAAAKKVTDTTYQGIKKLIRLPFEAMENK